MGDCVQTCPDFTVFDGDIDGAIPENEKGRIES